MDSRSVLAGVLLVGAIAGRTGALEKARAPTDALDRSAPWIASETTTVAYYNTCTGWVWAWSPSEPGYFGVFFDLGDEPYQLETLSYYATFSTVGYGYIGSMRVYEADTVGTIQSEPVASRSTLTTGGWNYVDWDTLVPGKFVVQGTFPISYLSRTYLASDHPAAGPTGPAASGTCYSATRPGHSFHYLSGDTIGRPPVPLADAFGSAEFLWTLRPKQSWFDDVTTPLTEQFEESVWRNGATWGDYDADGDPDILLPGPVWRYRLLRNDGSSGFAGISSPALSGASLANCTLGDFDNDGDLDIIAVDLESAGLLLRNDGQDEFVDVTPPSLASLFGSYVYEIGFSWADYDRDGDLDLFVKGSIHDRDLLFRNDGGASFVDVTEDLFPTTSDRRYARAASWADFDNDGDADLLAGCKLYRNESGTQFTEVLDFDSRRDELEAGSTCGAAWGDYDNDGYLDLYLSRVYAGFLYRNNGGDLVEVEEFDLGNGYSFLRWTPHYQGGWGDHNNDGYLDLYQANESGSNRLLENRGDGTFSDVTSGCLSDWDELDRGCAWADYDLDGRVDIYVTRQGYTYTSYLPAKNRLIRNVHSPDCHWLKVAVEGTTSNRQGVGARVRVVVGGLQQIREVSADDPHGSQTAYPLHFGLGAEGRVDSLIVRWPGGGEQVLTDLQVNRLVKVVQGAPGVEVPMVAGIRESRETALHPARPNPLGHGTEITFTLAAEGPVSLAIFDVGGRRIRDLLGGALPSGDHAVSWDGRGASGVAMPPGVYFVRLEAGGVRLSQKLVLLRTR